jgi:hypothetical protein
MVVQSKKHLEALDLDKRPGLYKAAKTMAKAAATHRLYQRVTGPALWRGKPAHAIVLAEIEGQPMAFLKAMKDFLLRTVLPLKHSEAPTSAVTEYMQAVWKVLEDLFGQMVSRPTLGDTEVVAGSRPLQGGFEAVDGSQDHSQDPDRCEGVRPVWQLHEYKLSPEVLRGCGGDVATTVQEVRMEDGKERREPVHPGIQQAVGTAEQDGCSECRPCLCCTLPRGVVQVGPPAA